MDLYICTTYYHVYVLVLKCLTGFQRICDVVVCNNIPTAKELRASLNNSGLFNNVWYVDQSTLPADRGKNRFDRIFFQHRRRYNEIKDKIPFDVRKYQNIYIFHDNTSLGRYLNDAKVKYHLIEDSYNFYQHIKTTPQAKHLRKRNYKFGLAKLLNVGYFPLGDSKFVIDIEVNENKALQISNKHIVELSRDAMRLMLSEEEKRIIFKIFGCPQFPIVRDNTVFLLTESFASDKVCTQEQQRKCYQLIVDDLQKAGYNVIIKPHPRDTIDYSDFGIYLMERTFPFETMVDLFGEKINYVATVSSSAALSLKIKKIFVYNHLLEEIKNE